LAVELQKGVELKPFPEIEAGFRIAMKDGSAYYNFTDRGIAEILAEYLNPKIAEIVQEAAQKET
jgi:V/A-type H+-transporting ATPase subunit E